MRSWFGLCLLGLGCAPRSGMIQATTESSLQDRRTVQVQPFLGITNAVELAANGDNICARLGSGDVLCRGLSELVDVPPDALEVATGWTRTCVRRPAVVECWEYGEAGMAETEPTLLTEVVKPDEMTLGRAHACFRRDGAQVWCMDASGALARVPGLDDAVQIAAGDDFTCARRASGGVACWGAGGRGQLGGGDRRDHSVPIEVVGLHDAAEVVAGAEHVCARRSDRTIACWGDNRRGQLTTAAGELATAPVQIAGISDAVQLASSAGNTCVLRAGGGLACWGDGPPEQFGFESSRPWHPPARPVAIDVRGVGEVVEVAVGGRSTCVRSSSGELACWGYLRGGSSETPATAGTVAAVDDAVELATGRRHACARRRSGAVVCWGRNEVGQLGDGTSEERATAVNVEEVGVVTALAAENDESCACGRDGEIFCWGPRPGDDRVAPPRLLGRVVGATDVAMGDPQRCVLRADGRVECWAYWFAGRHELAGVDDATQISASGRRVCARRASGSVDCWQWFGHGRDLRNVRLDPISALAGEVMEVRVGPAFACARLRQGSVVCWGEMWPRRRFHAAETAPVTIPGVTDAVELAVATSHACARRVSGEVLCWGRNREGQLGDGSTVDRSAATAVVGLDDAVEIAVEATYSCARRASGVVTCWGRGDPALIKKRSPSPRP